MTTPHPVILGLDVGGSAVKAGLVAADGEILVPHLRSARRPTTFDELVGIVRELADEMCTQRGAKRPSDLATGVGLGVPGLLDDDHGGVERSPNLPWLDGRPLRAALAEVLGVDPTHVHVENDANSAALGESWLGAGAERDDLFLLTLGTGIGGGVVLGNRLWRGRGMAGEIGHTKIHDTGPVCGCGRVGCLETFASASAAERLALAAGLPSASPGDLELLAERARAASGPERDLLEAIGEDLGRGVGAAINLFDLRTYLFGGGFAAALDVLLPGVRRGIEAASYGGRTAEIELLPAVLGPAAGWIGAARAAMLETP
ncbi:N-acetylglucosamine repressor [Planctomycetes bacterium Pla163]|uniref:N-acetylglucosamine repressor n=1 Tax=Rohdeia mirabilis TaxID=2528008 RepID=A0A518CWR1_9BACT|nr:N-acetylglucosamine repressor [Planctomycetes bacterium Pla163]